MRDHRGIHHAQAVEAAHAQTLVDHGEFVPPHATRPDRVVVRLGLRADEGVDPGIRADAGAGLQFLATQRIEELVYQLKAEYTIVIVTHNMQQAARVSDHTAFFWLGKLVEYGPTNRIYTNPIEKLTEDYVTGRFG